MEVLIEVNEYDEAVSVLIKTFNFVETFTTKTRTRKVLILCG